MIELRKIVVFIENIMKEAGNNVEPPLRKIAVAAVVKNPYAGQYSEDLSMLIDPSKDLGYQMSKLLVEMIEDRVQSYGKAAIVGINGEIEHAHAFLTSTFADELRKAVGGGKAWIASTAKRGTMGEGIDVPLACKDALLVRSHYDTMTISVPDAPEPDEAVVIIAASTRGRPNFRLGGLMYKDIVGEDGLR